MTTCWQGFWGYYEVEVVDAQKYIHDHRHDGTWAQDCLKTALIDRGISLSPPEQNYINPHQTAARLTTIGRGFMSSLPAIAESNDRQDKRVTGENFTVVTARCAEDGTSFEAKLLNAVPQYLLLKRGMGDSKIGEMKIVEKKDSMKYNAAREIAGLVQFKCW